MSHLPICEWIYIINVSNLLKYFPMHIPISTFRNDIMFKCICIKVSNYLAKIIIFCHFQIIMNFKFFCIQITVQHYSIAPSFTHYEDIYLLISNCNYVQKLYMLYLLVIVYVQQTIVCIYILYILNNW